MVKEATAQREQAEARMAALEKEKKSVSIEKREWEETMKAKATESAEKSARMEAMKAKQTQMGEALKVVATRRREA